MKITMICGLPGAGKTTLARTMSSENGTAVVGYDECLTECVPLLLKNQMRHADVINVVIEKIREILVAGKDVIYDAVNTNVKKRKKVLDAVQDISGIEIACIYVDTPLDICITRGGKPIAQAFARSFEPPTEDEGFDEIIVYHNVFPELEPELTDSERIEALEAIIQAQADALERLGVIHDA